MILVLVIQQVTLVLKLVLITRSSALHLHQPPKPHDADSGVFLAFIFRLNFAGESFSVSMYSNNSRQINP